MKYSMMTLLAVVVLTIIPASAVHAKDKILESSKLASNIVTIEDLNGALSQQQLQITKMLDQMMMREENSLVVIRCPSTRPSWVYNFLFL